MATTPQPLSGDIMPPPSQVPARRRLNARQQRMRGDLRRQFNQLTARYEKVLMRIFNRIGIEGRRAYEELALPKQQFGEDAGADARRIVDAMPMGEIQTALDESIIAQFRLVGGAVLRSLGRHAGINLGILRQPALDEMAAIGTLRKGLIDLDADTYNRLFRQLDELRDEGIGPAVIARRIREGLPAGPWSTPAIRSRVVARTETKFAQRTGVLVSLRKAQIDKVIIIDNQTGFNDPGCVFWNGREVTLQQAQQLSLDEHPNGTRDYVPVI